MQLFLELSILVVNLLIFSSCLNVQDFEEGACGRYKPQENFNATWFASASLPYVAAGSKYQLYRLGSGHPRFASLREFEFAYDSCLQCTIDGDTKVGVLYGFGLGEIGSFDWRLTNTNGVLNFYPRPSNGIPDEHTVTLTDNKSFIFFTNCWADSGQRAWDLISVTPTLTPRIQKLVEDHAVSLGFDREQFLFLRYDSCRPQIGGRNRSDLGRVPSGSSGWHGKRYS